MLSSFPGVETLRAAFSPRLYNGWYPSFREGLCRLGESDPAILRTPCRN